MRQKRRIPLARFSCRVHEILLALLVIAGSPIAVAQVTAFPGAEGGGRFVVGGRGGKVIEVTNLNDTGEGSLRAAVQAIGARTVVFRISGTILLNSTLTISNDSITIAGQTAPGDGICLRRYALVVNANQVILRHLRFRLGDEAGGEQDAVGGRYRRNIIVDHCSASWSTDETMSFYENDSLTVQWCIITESLYNSSHPKGAHGYGGMWGGRNSTFHHNLIAHHSSRNPRFGAGSPIDTCRALDFRNNIIYNWGFNSGYGGEFDSVNVVNNYYKYGPATLSGVRSRIVQLYDTISRWFVYGNYVDGYPAITADNWAGGVQGSPAADPAVRLGAPLAVEPVGTDSAAQAYEKVLNDAGATLPRRDPVDERIVGEVRTRTATYDGATYEKDRGLDTSVVRGIIDTQSDVGGWPDLLSAPAPADADHDGMPDDWEVAEGLNPGDAADRNVLSPDGYTMLEVYLNSLTIVSVPVAAAVTPPADLTVLPNYPNPFNPETHIAYLLAASGHVHVQIYDLFGRRVRELVNSVQNAGLHTVSWNGTDTYGLKLPSGVYFAAVRCGSSLRTVKMQLLR